MGIQLANGGLSVAQEHVDAGELQDAATGLFSVIVLVYDLEDKKIRFTSGQLCSELGYPVSDCSDEFFNLLNILHPKDLDSFKQVLEKLEHGVAGIREFNCRFLHKNGTFIPYKLKARTKAGANYAVIMAVNEDLQEYEEVNGQREQKHIDELQRSNKELEEFAYVASHDLQEPLRKISTFTGRLASSFGDKMEGDSILYIDRIRTAADNMRMLIDNLLEFSRIARMNQSFVETNLNFILHQVKTELELVIEESGTTIIADSLPSLNASPSQMKQLFCNLISNAIKFRKPGIAPSIHISAAYLDNEEIAQLDLPAGRVYHKIEFQDNGIGFENEYATKIFQIFQRLHGKSEYPGSGIGLAICKKILDHHQGLIYARNIPETGARFTFVVPE